MKHLKDVPVNNAQISDYISEGNPNTQGNIADIKSVSSDQRSKEVVQQAIKDDESLALIAKGIHVSVKGKVISLNGKANTKKQINIVTNIATAFTSIDKVNNHMGLNSIKPKAN